MNDEDKQKLSELLAVYRKTQDEIKTLEKTKDELKTEILTMIKINDVNDYDDDNYRMTLTKQSRKTFDRDRAVAFLGEHGANVDDYFDENEYEILKVIKKRGGIVE